MKQILTLLCLFVALAGVWLGVMENILQHKGYAGRTVIAACITLQAVATLLCILLNGRTLFRAVVLLAAIAIVAFGASVLVGTFRATHFEGYALIISLALILEGVLTVAVLLRTPLPRTA